MAFNPTIDKRLAKQKLDRIFGDLKSGTVVLTCGKHGYAAYVQKGAIRPPAPNHCPLCWEAYLVTDYAMTDPNIQYERLAELEEVIHHAVEFEKTGKFGKDFELYAPGDSRFEVHVAKDAADERGNDKVVLTDQEDLN